MRDRRWELRENSELSDPLRTVLLLVHTTCQKATINDQPLDIKYYSNGR